MSLSKLQISNLSSKSSHYLNFHGLLDYSNEDLNKVQIFHMIILIYNLNFKFLLIYRFSSFLIPTGSLFNIKSRLCSVEFSKF